MMLENDLSEDAGNRRLILDSNDYKWNVYQDRVENNGLVVLDAYAKDYNRNIATTYKMVDGYDGPAIIVEEGGTLAVNAAKFEGTCIEVDGGTVIVNKGTYYGSLTPFSSLAASVTGDGLFTNNLDTYTDVETTETAPWKSS